MPSEQVPDVTAPHRDEGAAETACFTGDDKRQMAADQRRERDRLGKRVARVGRDHGDVDRIADAGKPVAALLDGVDDLARPEFRDGELQPGAVGPLYAAGRFVAE